MAVGGEGQEFGRLLEITGGFQEPALLAGPGGVGNELLPSGATGGREIGWGNGVERRKVLEFDGHGVEKDGDAGVPAGLEDVAQVLLKIAINPLLAWVVRRKRMGEEHFHPAPGSAGFELEMADSGHEPLAGAGFLEGEAEAHRP